MRTAHIVCLLTVIVSGMGLSSSTPVTLPKNTTYISEISGLVIDIGRSGEAEFYPEYSQIQQLEDHQEEHIALYHGVSLIYITISDASQSPADRNEAAHAAQAPSVVAYTILDEHADATSRWFLVDMQYLLDFSRIRYAESQEARFDHYGIGVTVYSSPEQIMDTIDWLVRNVTIDSESLMMNTDYGHLQALLDGTSGVAPVVYDDHETTVLDWMQYGLVNRTRWESPSFGTPVTWADPWRFNFLRYSSIQIADGQYDVIKLMTDDHQGQVSIRIEPAGEDTVNLQDWADLWTSEHWGVSSGYNMTAIDVRVTDNTVTAILNGTGSYGEPFVAIFSVHIDGDGMAYTVDILSTREHMVDAVRQYEDAIHIDETQIPLAYTLEEVESLLGE